MQNSSDIPAFPQNAIQYPDSKGLSKRELIAAMALQGMLADHTRDGTFDEMAIRAIGFADALLAALERNYNAKN